MINKKDQKYYEKDFLKEEKEVLVLINDMSGGGLKLDYSWCCIMHIITYIDLETNTLHEGDGRVSWLISDEEYEKFGIFWPNNFNNGTIYRLIVRELKDKTIPEGYTSSIANQLMIVKVFEETIENTILNDILLEYRKPTIINDIELGEFELNKDLSFFSGTINWLDKQISVYLDVEVEKESTWTRSMNNLRKLYLIQETFDEELREFARKQLLDTANSWQEEVNNPKLTQTEFKNRMNLSHISTL